MATRATDIRARAEGDGLFVRIGAFLAQHRLSPEPHHYAFAYRVIATDAALAKEVERLTDGGIRLSAADIERLGGTASAGMPVGDDAPDSRGEMPPHTPAEQQALVARALDQLDGFTDTIRTVHEQTGDFGRDLRASADAITLAGKDAGIAEITRITAAMLDRVQHAEARLAAARQEADELRGALDEARGTALRDALTELPNRRAYDQALAALGSRQQVLAICDIDHFKSVNDDFGHAVGDRVLKAVAQTLAAEVDGMVSRWGGEEFAILFDHDDLLRAGFALDRARAALAARRLRVRETGQAIGTISFSAGAALVTGPHDGEAALRRADAALYRAKSGGRGRTDLAG